MKSIASGIVRVGLIGAFLTAFVILLGLPVQTAQAGSSTGKRIVVSLKQDPVSEEGAEAACVAFQIGTLFLQKEKARVSMFTSLGGVYVANADYHADPSIYDRDPVNCFTPNGIVPLTNVVNGFIANGGRIVVCPLCWISRFGAPGEPDYSADLLIDGAEIGNADSMTDLFFKEAHKILDF